MKKSLVFNVFGVFCSLFFGVLFTGVITASINQPVGWIEPQIDPFFKPVSQDEIAAPTVEQQNYDFSGIVKLSNCSAALIRYENDTETNKPALVLTNGHCLGMGTKLIESFGIYMPAYGEVLIDVDAVRRVQIYGKNGIKGTALTQKIVYGTMTDTDLAIYTLDKTYQQIEDEFDVKPLVLSSKRPEPQTDIEIISGYWNRGYSCAIDSEVFKMQEDEWFWTESIKYTQPGCETIGGTSGSPIVHKQTREVIGVNNTAYEGGEACTLMNPCEIDKDGVITTDAQGSYGQQTFKVYGCLNDAFEIDLSIDGCALPIPE